MKSNLSFSTAKSILTEKNLRFMVSFCVCLMNISKNRFKPLLRVSGKACRYCSFSRVKRIRMDFEANVYQQVDMYLVIAIWVQTVENRIAFFYFLGFDLLFKKAEPFFVLRVRKLHLVIVICYN